MSNIPAPLPPSSGYEGYRYLSYGVRWLILIFSLLISFTFIRYPFAVQNFMRADGLLALDLVDQAIVHYRRAVLLFPEFEQAYSMLAWSYELKKDYAKAEEAYEKGLRAERVHNDELLYLHYILFLWKVQKNEKAVKIAREACDAFPGGRNPMRVYGHALEKAHDIEGAAEAWRKYLLIYPADDAAKNKLRALMSEPRNR